MIGRHTRGVRGAWDDASAAPYRFVTDGWSGDLPFAAFGTPGDDVFAGTDAEDEYHGLAGNDTIDGGKDGDRLYGDEGDDTIKGGDGNDILDGGLGRDVIYGGRGRDQMSAGDDGRGVFYGNQGRDSFSGVYSIVYGGNGIDFLSGQWCQLHGGGGNDRITIFTAFDRTDYPDGAWGGSGADIFAFGNGIVDRLLGGEYVIHDLENLDIIDLSLLDANPRNDGDQAFRLVPEFTGRPGDMTIRYDAAQNMTLIELYTGKNMTVDGTILVPGDHTDFVNFVF